MFIEEMYLENWCQHASLRVPLRPGVNGIIGANGNGKSNFLDAIRLLFTGESINPGGREDNLKWGTKAGHVLGKVHIGDLTYEIKRNIHNGGCHMKWTEPDGTKHDLRKIGEVQAKINELLGTTAATMLDAVFVPQGKIDGILFQKNTERLKDFQQAFGLAAAADAFRILGEEVDAFRLTPGLQESFNDAVTKFRASVADVARIQGELEEVEAKMAALAPQEAVLQRRDRAQQHNTALKAADQAVANAEAAAARIALELTPVEVQFRTQESNLSGQDAELPALRRRHAELVNLKANHERYQAAAQNRNALKAALQAMAVVTDEDVAALAIKETEANNLVQQITGMLNGSVVRPQVPVEVETNKAFQDLNLAIQIRQGKGTPWSPELIALRDKARDLKGHLASFATGKCPTCGQDVAGGPAEAERRKAELADVIARGTAMEQAEQAAEQAILAGMAAKRDALNEQLRGFKEACTAFLTQQLQGAQASLSSAQGAANAGRAVLQQRKQIVAQLQTFEVSLGVEVPAPDDNEIALVSTNIAALEAAADRVEGLRRQVGDIKARLEAQRGAVQAAKDSRAALGTVLDAPTDDEVAAATAAVPVLFQLRQAVAKLQSDAAMAAVTRDARDQECIRLRAQVATEAKHSSWIKHVKEARDVLHVGQLPKLIMQEYGKILNNQLGFYLETFQSPIQLWLNDDLEFRSTKNGEAEMDALRLSGAEKIVASVSFRMGMSDTFARQVGLLILDEPSNYLDPANIHNLQMVLLELKKMSAHTGRQVLVVTHEERLMNYFDHTIQIGAQPEEKVA